MADPTVSTLVASNSAVAATTVTFTAQTAGTLLLLSVTSEAYLTTSGSGRPESSGWTQVQVLGSPHWMGCSLYWKLSNGSETTVTYTIASAAGSSYVVDAATEIDGTDPFDVSAIANSATNIGGVNAYTGPTSPTTSAGRKLGYATFHRIADGTTTGLSSPTNSFVQQSVSSRTTGDRPAVVTLKRVFDGTAGTGTGGTFAPAAGGNYQHAGIIAIFNNATGGSSQAVTGTIAITSALTGSPTELAAASGSTPVVSVTTGAPAARLGITGTLAVTSTTSGTTNTLEPASGTTPIVATVSGAPTTLAIAAGMAAIVSTARGAANIGGSLAASGTVAVTTASSGAASLRATAAGTVAVITALTGSATTLEPTSGTTVITSAVSGAVTTRAVAAGSVPIVSTTMGAVDVQAGGSLATAGTVTVTTASSGRTGQRHAATATVAVVSASSGTARSRQTVTGTVAVVSAVNGSAGQQQAVTALVAIVSATSGTAGKTIPLAGVVVIASTASGSPVEGGWVGPIIPRVLVAYLRDDGQYVGKLHDNGRYEARVR